VKRVLTALSLALIVAATTSAAEARPHHNRHHQTQVHHAKHASRHHYRVAQPVQQEPSFADSFQSGFQSGFSAGSGVVSRAREFIGETAHQVGVRGTLWCSAFLRKVTGASDVDDRALSWERHQHIAPQVGAVVTMGRRGGGHVGVVSGFTAKGDPIVISGNHGGRVREAVYSRSRIRAWVSAS
jgi:uncharacterized protein (TIGR02594 family)